MKTSRWHLRESFKGSVYDADIFQSGNGCGPVLKVVITDISTGAKQVKIIRGRRNETFAIKLERAREHSEAYRRIT